MLTARVQKDLERQNISVRDYTVFKAYVYRRRCLIICSIFAIINTLMFYTRTQRGFEVGLSDFVLTPIKLSVYLWVFTLIIINIKSPEHLAIKQLEKMYTKRFRKFNILLERINNLKLRRPGEFIER